MLPSNANDRRDNANLDSISRPLRLSRQTYTIIHNGIISNRQLGDVRAANRARAQVPLAGNPAQPVDAGHARRIVHHLGNLCDVYTNTRAIAAWGTMVSPSRPTCLASSCSPVSSSQSTPGSMLTSRRLEQVLPLLCNRLRDHHNLHRPAPLAHLPTTAAALHRHDRRLHTLRAVARRPHRRVRRAVGSLGVSVE